MKKIFGYMLIAILSLTMQLNADLLNGPYSKESQELLKLAQDTTLPIPENLKSRKELIELFREWLANNRMADTESPSINDPVSLEAAIQVIKLRPLQESRVSGNLNDQQLPSIMDLAKAHDDMNLYVAAFKQLSPEAQEMALDWIVMGILFSNDPKKFESLKQEFKMVSPGHDVKNSVYDSAAAYIRRKNLPSQLDFFISSGFPVNYIPADAEKKETLLDVVNNVLSKNYKDDKDLLAIREYLKSKGAKTYAELQQGK